MPRGTNTSGLRRGGPGRPKGSKDRYTRAHAEFLKLLSSDPEYRDSFWRRAVRGDASLDRMILEHVIGKPTDRHEITGANGQPFTWMPPVSSSASSTRA